MKEEFLHYLWRYRLFREEGLCTTSGDPVKIEDPGYVHQDGGPDLQNARIRIGETLWAGNVEIHFRSSQWYEHEHHKDPAYDNVILHVVLEADRDCKTSSGVSIDALELKERIPEGLARAYQRFIDDRRTAIPCGPMIGEIPPLVLWNWVDRLALERLERKAERIQDLWELSERDPRETFYRLLARYFGGKVNAPAFEQLAFRTPMKLLVRYKDQLGSLEALLFGQAGFLDGEAKDPYMETRQEEYRFQRRVWGLRGMDPSAWRFLRLRPANFPTVRIAQFAAFLHRNGDPWKALEGASKDQQLLKIFDVEASEYWRDHYKFGKGRKRRTKAALGEQMKKNLLVNAVAPFLFFFGELWERDEWRERGVRILEGLGAEENAILRRWKKLGIEPENAFRSQGLIELKGSYCDTRNCLNCSIGDRILKKEAP